MGNKPSVPDSPGGANRAAAAAARAGAPAAGPAAAAAGAAELAAVGAAAAAAAGAPANPAPLIQRMQLDWGERVCGQEEAKRTIEYSFFLPRKFPTFFSSADGKNKRSEPRSILLWGPPGTGKTLIAQAFADAHQAKLVKFEPGMIISKWVGDTEALIRQLFISAKNEKTVLFIDEIDSFLRTRQESEREHERMQKTQFLQSIQDFLEHMTVDSALVACTNTLNELDPALLRRFEIQVFCGLPSEAERAQLLEHNMKDYTHELSKEHFRHLAARTPLYSGSDIARLVSSARMGPVSELQTATHFLRLDNGKLMPSDPTNTQAIEVILKNLEDDSLAPRRPVCLRDFEFALRRAKATLTKAAYDVYLKQAQEQDTETTTRLNEQGNIAPTKSTFQREIEAIFCPEEGRDLPEPFVLFGEMTRYIAVAQQPESRVALMRQQLSLPLAVILVLLSLVMPSFFWCVCAGLSGLYLLCTVFGPLGLDIYRSLHEQDTVVDYFTQVNFSRVLNLLVFVAVVISPVDYMPFSNYKILNNLVTTLFFIWFVEVTTWLFGFFSLRNNNETQRLFHEQQ